ncbi:hypothetical protein RD110_00925 [Rhodoferax koreense]|uniref:Aldose epimerase n=1 Tax=Rhodoferax koreensis TaxID=1842727 RepID=A0A1P8JQD6_9BURK|nr:aldose 1-epimerase [Rhodoferax koreense]APW35949.1 hypothetical protein RD110_00925 [Rhodoferax koreense]
MTSPLVLQSGALRCELRPELGGCITGLWFGDVPVLRSAPAHTVATARLGGSYAMVPFSNRIAQAHLLWQGTSHPLVQNNGPEPHAIHGHGWQRAWEVLECDATSALIGFEHRPDAAWPFAFDTSQSLRITGHALEITLSATNRSATEAPIGLGWHPYFAKRGEAHIAFTAAGRWENGADMLPTHREASTGIDADCAAIDVDHCFDGWNGVVQLTDERLRIRIGSNLDHLVVFTNAGKNFVAIEPVSHVNNALNLMAAGRYNAAALGVSVLQPGETKTATMSISVEAV